MADEPGLPNFQAAAIEVTSALPQPTRPEADYSRTGPAGPGLVENQQWANDYDKAVQAHAQQRHPQPDVQPSEKQQALIEAAQALAPKENAKPELQQAQELQMDKEQGR